MCEVQLRTYIVSALECRIHLVEKLVANECIAQLPRSSCNSFRTGANHTEILIIEDRETAKWVK